MPDRDPLYLFFCHMEWRNHGDLAAYNQLVAALDDSDPAIRELAQHLFIAGRRYRRTAKRIQN